ncbi:MAG: SEL1-like repeat protein [Clostridiales bacterium]|nr:SEL1-like repeat protein [Clostridiales bacterium]
MGLCYMGGYGVTRNRSTARMWLQKAAAQGNEDAKKALRNL